MTQASSLCSLSLELSLHVDLTSLHKALQVHHRGQQQQRQCARTNQRVEVRGPAVLLHNDGQRDASVGGTWRQQQQQRWQQGINAELMLGRL